ncbi:unnamed protein product [Macrosiphum euphorbiae]|uniref:Uncharacterized protein n=1 Tax=Macrosiphum euphorbiae TaxID=13131 RepID=A0AAV0XXR5_9HEMI|nr:unnamed protein product [Macrosiphum euphorbiae]
MYGIADADDVRRYDSTIDKLENNEKDVMRIVHDQISILKSTIINFNDSVTSFNENEKIFDSNMKEGEKKVNEMIIEIAKEDGTIIILSSITLLKNSIFELDMFISRLQRVISNVPTEQYSRCVYNNTRPIAIGNKKYSDYSSG